MMSSNTEHVLGGVTASPHGAVPDSTSSPQHIQKKSQPIAIEPPSRRTGRRAYTPLSARGDLLGGYFPNHEDTHAIYKPHPFGEGSQRPAIPAMRNSPSSSPTMSSKSSSVISSPSLELTAKAAHGILASSFSAPVPEPLNIPKGKYHPSNYKIPVVATSENMRPPPPSLMLPLKSSSKGQRVTHVRQPSEVKSKLQQYQRDMIKQARIGSGLSSSKLSAAKPTSPRLLPLGSPGPITPLELEESSGYLLAGSRNHSFSSESLQNDREREMVERMIQAEQASSRREGRSSPTTKV